MRRQRRAPLPPWRGLQVRVPNLDFRGASVHVREFRQTVGMRQQSHIDRLARRRAVSADAILKSEYSGSRRHKKTSQPERSHRTFK